MHVCSFTYIETLKTCCELDVEAAREAALPDFEAMHS